MPATPLYEAHDAVKDARAVLRKAEAAAANALPEVAAALRDVADAYTRLAAVLQDRYR